MDVSTLMRLTIIGGFTAFLFFTFDSIIKIVKKQ